MLDALTRARALDAKGDPEAARATWKAWLDWFNRPDRKEYDATGEYSFLDYYSAAPLTPAP